ncbi:MAG: OmpA family protein [bacterium]
MTALSLRNRSTSTPERPRSRRSSFEILDAVVKVLQENPQITKIRIEGHTDDRGADEMNLKLSQGRADAVLKYMTENGVAEGRLKRLVTAKHDPSATMTPLKVGRTIDASSSLFSKCASTNAHRVSHKGRRYGGLLFDHHRVRPRRIRG